MKIGQIHVDFAKKQSLKIMNTFFDKKVHQRWTWKCSSEVANEVDFILTNGRAIIINVTVLNWVNIGSKHRMVRAEIRIHLRKESNNLMRKPPTTLTVLQNRIPKFSVSILNRYAALYKENCSIKETNNFTKIWKEAVVVEGVREEKVNHSILALETKLLMKECLNMKVQSLSNKI